MASEKKYPGFILEVYMHLKQFIYHFLPNSVVSHIPSYFLRHLFYRGVLGIKIGKGSSIHKGAFFYDRRLKVGLNSTINRKCHLDCRGIITIGDNVSISSECMLITGDHDLDSVDFRYRSGSITIENYVWLGTRVIILPNVSIGEGAVVCAGAVVTKNVDPYTIVGGVPAKFIRHRSSELNYSASWFFPYD
jgi:acetyltransferase-like isoleucine patch superfamily enzyme